MKAHEHSKPGKVQSLSLVHYSTFLYQNFNTYVQRYHVCYLKESGFEIE